MEAVTSRLPREDTRTQQASQEWRLSVGVKKGNGVQKLGYWNITKRVKDGKATNYLLDEAMQARLRAINDDAQPKVLPCSVIGNPVDDPLRPGHLTIPDSIIFREIAAFGAGRRHCYCQDPQAAKPVCMRATQETVTAGDKTFKRITGYHEMPCTRDDKDKPCTAWHSDPPKCKPHIIVPLYLPWSGNSGACVYRTTGWTAFDSMVDSLLAIAAMTNGWLHGLPLEFVYEEKQVGANQFWVPAPRFRLVTQDARQALLAGNEMRGLYAGDGQKLLQARSEEVRDGIAASIADPHEQRETQEEFYPDATDAEFTAGDITPEEAAAIKAAEAAEYERQYGGGSTQRLFG